jgi:hypothetical protein
MPSTSPPASPPASPWALSSWLLVSSSLALGSGLHLAAASETSFFVDLLACEGFGEESGDVGYGYISVVTWSLE